MHIRYLETGNGRLAFLFAAHTGNSRQTGKPQIMVRIPAIRTGRTITGQGTINDAGINPGSRCIIHTQFFQYARAETFYDHVSGFNQFQELLPAGRHF